MRILPTGDISTFYSNVSAIDPFLSPCLKYASDLIPATSISGTPIYFAATAGMRLLKYLSMLVSLRLLRVLTRPFAIV